MAARFIPIGNAQSELNRRSANDLESRRRATTILPPEWLDGKKASPATLLTTTLGGTRRLITNEDLIAFRKRAQELGSKLREGLTALEIIDLSTLIDRERARTQIPTAMPTRLRAGEVIFTTSAGPDSKVTRHFVTVKFPSYDAAVAMPGTGQQAAAELVKMPLKFDCDCPHHRYRFRYITSVMGAAANRIETGFCKLTNPTLTGIACKHALRVFAELGGMLVRQMVGKMIDADRGRLAGTARSKPQIISISREQAERAQTSGRRPKAIRTRDEQARAAVLAGLRKAMPAGSTRSQATDLKATVAALQARQDIGAKTILSALQALLQQPGAR